MFFILDLFCGLLKYWLDEECLYFFAGIEISQTQKTILHFLKIYFKRTLVLFTCFVLINVLNVKHEI